MLAKKNQEQAARILAKQLIETRQQKTRIMGMKSQISSTSIQSKVNEFCWFNMVLNDFFKIASAN